MEGIRASATFGAESRTCAAAHLLTFIGVTRIPAADWKRAYKSSICLLQSSRCGHRLAVGNVAMK
jgi:hypothetical protein